jgi:hypothetical protein
MADFLMLGFQTVMMTIAINTVWELAQSLTCYIDDAATPNRDHKETQKQKQFFELLNRYENTLAENRKLLCDHRNLLEDHADLRDRYRILDSNYDKRVAEIAELQQTNTSDTIQTIVNMPIVSNFINKLTDMFGAKKAADLWSTDPIFPNVEATGEPAVLFSDLVMSDDDASTDAADDETTADTTTTDTTTTTSDTPAPIDLRREIGHIAGMVSQMSFANASSQPKTRLMSMLDNAAPNALTHIAQHIATLPQESETKTAEPGDVDVEDVAP